MRSIVTGLREQLFHLLAEASEIEHTLMCSYLYICFSLKAADSGNLSSIEAEAVTRWRKVILGVAIEEMAHLLLVANLSTAIGGKPHFFRPNFPVPSGYFPSGVVVRLTSFSMETLDHVIFLERPVGFDVPDGAGFTDAASYRREEAFHGLMPSIQDYNTVGDLYEVLRANLRAADQRLGDARLFIGTASAQVSGESIGVAKVATIATLSDALAAIDTIVEQGEGSPADRSGSHYQQFVAIRAEYRQLLEANPSFAPAWPVASNPVMRRPPDPEDKVFLESPDAAQLVDFGTAVYGLLLRLLVQMFGRQTADAADIQHRFLGAATKLMHVVAVIGDVLATLPANPGSPVNAGMTFTMLRGVEPLLVGGAERQLLEERLDELSDAAGAILPISPLLRQVPEGLQSARQALWADVSPGQATASA